MKTLMFVAAVSLLSVTGAFAQGVMFDPSAPSPVYGPYPRHPDVGVFDYGQPVPQQIRHRDSRRDSRTDTRHARQRGDQQSLHSELR
jgi:hypothetical protein